MAKSQTKSKSLTIAELERLIKEHRGTIEDILITPEIAAYILKSYNTGNRKLRIGHANAFADTLKRGGWENTGEPIIFAQEGVLNNGQHRLEGIVRAKIPAPVDIRFGIPRSAFSITDTGAKRQAGDVLSIMGSSSPFASAAGIKLLLAYEQGLPSAYTGRIGNDQILAGFHRWPDIEQAVDITHRVLKRKGFVNASSYAFTLLALRQTNDKEKVEDFLGLVESGLTKALHDAPRLLRERLLADAKFSHGARAQTIERLALFIKAWNYWQAGERPKRLIWGEKEEFPLMKKVNL